MDAVVSQERLTNEIFALFEETFETHHGIYLDRGTSLFETLQTFTAAEASQPVGGTCASLAAQVAHVTFYLDVLERGILTGSVEKVDWGEIWRTVQAVTPDEWITLREQLRHSYQRILAMLRSRNTWDDETTIAGSLAMVVHTAYHLGEIRQALCILKAGSSPHSD